MIFLRTFCKPSASKILKVVITHALTEAKVLCFDGGASNVGSVSGSKVFTNHHGSEDPPIDPGVDQPLQWRAIVTHDCERLKEAGEPFGSVDIHCTEPHPEKWADQKSRNDDVNDEI